MRLVLDIKMVATYTLEAADRQAALAAELGRVKADLKTVYGLATEIRRQTAFAEIGFKCSLIREVVSRSLPDDEAKRLYDQTEAALDTATAVAPGAEAGVAETCPDCGHLDHAGRRCLAGCSIWHCSAGRRAVAPGASDAGER